MTNMFKLTKTDSGFYYMELGYAFHYHPTHKIWVNRNVVIDHGIKKNNDIYLKFPLDHVTIKETDKGNLVLVPDEVNNTFYVEVACGYRGKSTIDIQTPTTIAITSSGYQSEVGSLGKNAIVLVSTPEKELVYHWTKTGRLYGEPNSGTSKIALDGTTSDVVDDNNLRTLL